jgi:hypothetical protein
MEKVNKDLESKILRPYQFCFRKAYNEFMKGDVSDDAIFEIVKAGFIKVFTRGVGFYVTDVGSWLSRRIRNPGISLRKRN